MPWFAASAAVLTFRGTHFDRLFWKVPYPIPLRYLPKITHGAANALRRTRPWLQGLSTRLSVSLRTRHPRQGPNSDLFPGSKEADCQQTSMSMRLPPSSRQMPVQPKALQFSATRKPWLVPYRVRVNISLKSMVWIFQSSQMVARVAIASGVQHES